MAKVRVDIDDLVSTWKDKTNDLANQVGDLASLRTIEDSDMVGAINEIWGLARLDSSGIVDLLSPNFDSIEGEIDQVSALFPVTSANLSGPSSLLIYDSTGVIVKSIFGADV